MKGWSTFREPCRARSFGLAGLALVCLLPFFLPSSVRAEAGLATGSTGKEDPIQTAALEPAKSVVLERQRLQTLEELSAISSNVEVTEEVLSRLDREIETLRNDRDEIRQAMIDAALRQKEASAKLTELEAQIEDLSSEEGALKASLAERRGLLAEVLAALQRLGRKPPPALLVKPEDALGSVRSSILLGSVVPSLRDETRVLLADLEKLNEVQSELSARMRSFGDELSAHRREEERLKRLAAKKASLAEENLERRNAAKRRADELAGKAEDLKGLIASLDEDVKTARLVEEAEREAAEKARAEAAEKAREAERVEREREIAERKERLKAERLAQLEADKQAAEVEALKLAESNRAAEAAQLAREAEARRLAEAAKATEAQKFADVETEAAEENQRIAETKVAETGPRVTDALSAVAATEEPYEIASLDPDESPQSQTQTDAYDIEALRRSVRFLEPSAPFSTMKGRLIRPVAGRNLIGFGERDDIGRQTTGASYASRSGDVVTAPADAKVLYSGPFRSYGEVLILDAGDGYHVVLAGMDRIDVETGQFVSAGEPIAAMGSRRLASVNATDFGTEGPALYVEFRKNGRPVDPSAWWAD
ncbi:peptidoglycan DD-metalloendopeptidase family protein [Fulvimarina sp. MAC8]|uniref:peptidoglycan DD-metalloendopeptidase family protein n=1 Tax=Fulvimarina sp. MAC8 TaxID=3162874 RepID=UPI0032EA9DF5